MNDNKPVEEVIIYSFVIEMFLFGLSLILKSINSLKHIFKKDKE